MIGLVQICILVLASLLHRTSSFQISSNPLSLHQRCNSSNNNNKSNNRQPLYLSSQSNDEKPYFLRKAVMGDLSHGARILADGFYSESNPASKWWERLHTQMSLESNWPNPVLRNQHEMWVAVQSQNGQILAFCELDNRPPRNDSDPEAAKIRPYMCNLAVHLDWRKQGLAQDMIHQCEASVELWSGGADEKLFLKVKEQNQPAVNLYTKLGYGVVSSQVDEKTEETLLVMKRDWKAEVEEANNVLSTSYSPNYDI